MTDTKLKQAHEEGQRASIHSAPKGLSNLPGLRCARKIQEEIHNLVDLNVETFLTQVPIEACGQFDPESAIWWLTWCSKARERALTEGIDIARHGIPIKHLPAIPRQPIQERILDSLRRQGPLTIDQLSNGLIRSPNGPQGISAACKDLREMGLVGCDTRAKPYTYRATVPDPSAQRDTRREPTWLTGFGEWLSENTYPKQVPHQGDSKQ